MTVPQFKRAFRDFLNSGKTVELALNSMAKVCFACEKIHATAGFPVLASVWREQGLSLERAADSARVRFTGGES